MHNQRAPLNREARANVVAATAPTHAHGVRMSRSVDERVPPERFRRAIRGYRKLVTLVEARDADGAARHWRRHMEAASVYPLGDDLRDKPVVDLFA